MKTLIFCLFTTCLLFSQEQPVTRDATFYRNKGFQVFDQYRLAIKVPCKITDTSQYTKANNDLDYGGFDDPYTQTRGAAYMIAIKRLPMSYSNLNSSQKIEFADDLMLNKQGSKVVYLQIQNERIRSYLYETTDKGYGSKAIIFFRANYRYSFHILSNDNIQGRLNALTNNIVFF